MVAFANTRSFEDVLQLAKDFRTYYKIDRALNPRRYNGSCGATIREHARHEDVGVRRHPDRHWLSFRSVTVLPHLAYCFAHIGFDLSRICAVISSPKVAKNLKRLLPVFSEALVRFVGNDGDHGFAASMDDEFVTAVTHLIQKLTEPVANRLGVHIDALGH